MKMKESKDPWTEGQKQITFPIPGWLVFLVKAPFRLLAGILGAAGALQIDTKETEVESSVPQLDHRYNWDGSINTDGDVTSGK